MLLKTNKILIYILLSIIIFSLIFPFKSYAFDEESVYVWSNNSSVITSTPSEESKNNEENETSRKFFRYNFRKCHINGSKNWNYFI